MELIFFKFNCIELKYIELDSNAIQIPSASYLSELNSNSIEKKRNAN
jgi:hypothetical protein